MKKLIQPLSRLPLMGLLLILTYNSSSQDTTGLSRRLKQISDSVQRFRIVALTMLGNDTINENYFSKPGFDFFFDKYFTLMKYDRESFAEGNSASLTTDDKANRIDLSLSYKKSNNIFTLGTALNISDKSGLIFSDSKPTSGTEFSFGYSSLTSFFKVLNFRGPEMRSNWRKRLALIDSISTVHIDRNPLYGEVIKRKLETVDADISRQQASLRATKDNARISVLQDSLVQSFDKRTKLNQEFETLNQNGKSAEVITENIIETGKKRQIQLEMETDGVNSFYMQWVSFGLKYRKDQYATYDSMLAFSQSIGKQDFEKWTITGSFNFLWQRTDSWIKFLKSRLINSAYFNVNYTLMKTNNYEDLSEENLSISQIRVQNDTTYEFSTSKKLRNISGKKFESTWMHQLGIVGTMIFGKKQFWGLNLSATGQFKKTSSTVLNSRIGLLFRFKDSDTEKSTVNFEFFFSFNDMTDTKEIGKSIWQRKQIGVSTNIPFKKVFFR
ncbi:MAG: hypothetical protein QM791_18555 [Ferruginibacter sp.]